MAGKKLLEIYIKYRRNFFVFLPFNKSIKINKNAGKSLRLQIFTDNGHR